MRCMRRYGALIDFVTATVHLNIQVSFVYPNKAYSPLSVIEEGYVPHYESGVIHSASCIASSNFPQHQNRDESDLRRT